MVEKQWSRATLDGVVERALRFLTGVSRSPLIRGKLAAHGYTDDDHEEGWSLFHAAAGYQKKKTPVVNDAARDAERAIDAWDEPTFAKARGALQRLHPAEAEILFEDLEPATGAASLVSAKRFLDRLDAFETTPGGKAALVTLEKRGITPAERTRIRDLLALVEEGAAPASLAPAGDLDAQLIALKAWLDDWSATARTVITRRDQRIALGLAQRRAARPTAGTATEPDDES